MHPYRLNLIQNLRQGDNERRITFIAWLVTELENNPII